MDSNDIIDEEMLIASEQDMDETALHAEVFKQPIKVLNLKKPVYVFGNASIFDVVELMRKTKEGAVLIINEDNRLEGIFTERDLLNKIVGIVDDLKKAEVGEYMTRNPEALECDDMICFALNNMHIGGYRNIPIVDRNGAPYAIINIKDVNDFLLDYFPHEINNILSAPYKGVHLRESG